MILGPPVRKQPNETFPISADFARKFKPTEAIVTQTITAKLVIDGSDSSSLLSGPTFAGSIAQVRLAVGGTVNDNHMVQFRINTSLGNTYEAEVPLNIRED